MRNVYLCEQVSWRFYRIGGCITFQASKFNKSKIAYTITVTVTKNEVEMK